MFARISLRPRLASMWQRRAPSRFQKTVTCFFLNASIEQQRAVAFILLPLCLCLGLTMELAAAQATAILTSLISSFVDVPMCVRISVNSIAEWHITSCLATSTTISAITVSCLPRKAGHSLLHTTSILERSHINACLSIHTQKSQTSTPYSLQVRTTCLNNRRQKILLKRFE